MTDLRNRCVDLIERATRYDYRRALCRRSLRDRQTDTFCAAYHQGNLPAIRSI
jgi:hypothetical protein